MMKRGLPGMLLGLALAGAAVRADAQTAGVPAAPIPVELTAELREGRVECRPTVARLPARQAFSLNVVNRTDRAIRFESSVLVSDPHPPPGRASTGVPSGRVVTAESRSTARLSFRSPAAGEYPFRCVEEGGDRDEAPDGRFVVIAIDPRR